MQVYDVGHCLLLEHGHSAFPSSPAPQAGNSNSSHD